MSILIVILLAVISLNGHASGGSYTPPPQASSEIRAYSGTCDSISRNAAGSRYEFHASYPDYHDAPTVNNVADNRVDNPAPNNNSTTILFATSSRPSRERGVHH